MYDLLIIGGGINGTGIARDAAGRGLSVCLCEQHDLASHTSSASTKLVHGGLRYLEHFEFRLVRESLKERETLMRAAPHIIWPMRFVLPHRSGGRPAWMIRIGLFLYDHAGGRKLLNATKYLKRRSSNRFKPLEMDVKSAFEYSDCWVEDSRLVVLNAVDARERGADVLTRTACTALERHADHWSATLTEEGGDAQVIKTRAIVNAAGPWVSDIAGMAAQTSEGRLRLIKGSHIVVPRLYPGEQAYLLQNSDGRVIFTIPYEGEYTLIGTTDVPHDESDRATTAISAAETDYLCDVVNRYLSSDITPADVVWAYAGLRPLFDDNSSDASKITRDYHFDYSAGDGGAPILSVFGGKITTYRRLAEKALHRMKGDIAEMSAPWTETAPLPGGNIADADFEGFLKGACARFPWCPPLLLRRLARAYGTRIYVIIGEATGISGFGPEIAPGLHVAELHYLAEHEFARTAEDVIWRRSKLGLHGAAEKADAIDAWFENYLNTKTGGTTQQSTAADLATE